MGPLPGPLAASRVKQLSKARAKILELLDDGPCTVSSIATFTSQHENTVREHLDALVDEELAIKYQSTEHLRGRPAWFFQKSNHEDQSRYGEYSGLLKVLAGSIARTNSHPTADAVSAGVEWARELIRHSQLEPIVQGRKTSGTNSKQARRNVIALLSQLGFEPTPNASLTRNKLNRCPLLDAAKQYPEIICNVHLGVVRGALVEFGASEREVKDSILQPFSEPGACLLRM